MHYPSALKSRLASKSLRLLLAGAALVAYVVLFTIVYYTSPAGAGATYLSGIAVSAVGWLLGRWVGVAAALLTLPLNLLLLLAVGVPLAEAVVPMDYGAGCAANVIVG